MQDEKMGTIWKSETSYIICTINAIEKWGLEAIHSRNIIHYDKSNDEINVCINEFGVTKCIGQIYIFTCHEVYLHCRSCISLSREDVEVCWPALYLILERLPNSWYTSTIPPEHSPVLVQTSCDLLFSLVSEHVDISG